MSGEVLLTSFVASHSDPKTRPQLNALVLMIASFGMRFIVEPFRRTSRSTHMRTMRSSQPFYGRGLFQARDLSIAATLLDAVTKWAITLFPILILFLRNAWLMRIVRNLCHDM